MKKIRQQLMMVTATAVMAATLSGCRSENRVPSFKNAKEALRAGRIELKRISSKDGATLEEVGKMCNRWLQMHDSCEAVFGRDTTFDFSGETALHFIDVSDSIREGIMILALERDHTTEEVMDLKLGTAPQRKVLQESQAYKDAARFFEGLDQNALCKNLDETVGRFDSLMRKEIRTDSKGLLEFLTEEDICFRSLMDELSEVPDDILRKVTVASQKAFSRLDKKLQREIPEEQEDMLQLFMTMRLNRRLLQNAEACRRDILQGKPLAEQTAMNYRWMLIQPVSAMTVENVTALTDDQQKQLRRLARELPKLLATLDGKNTDIMRKQELQKLDRALAEYILKTHLMGII